VSLFTVEEALGSVAAEPGGNTALQKEEQMARRECHANATIQCGTERIRHQGQRLAAGTIDNCRATYTVEWHPNRPGEYLLIIGKADKSRTESFKSWGEALLRGVSLNCDFGFNSGKAIKRGG
jgi:hypothetical protein